MRIYLSLSLYIYIYGCPCGAGAASCLEESVVSKDAKAAAAQAQQVVNAHEEDDIYVCMGAL